MSNLWIENALSRAGKSSNIKVSNEKIDAPTESPHASFEAYNDCKGQSDYYYGDLWAWWKDHKKCVGHDVSAKDVNLLITEADGGGLGAGKYAVAGGTFHIANNYSSYVDYSFHNKASKMETVLEEVGHSLTDGVADWDFRSSGDGKLDHDNGMVYDRPEGKSMSPIGVTGYPGRNNCGKDVQKSDWNGNAAEFKYSDCAAGFFEKK